MSEWKQKRFWSDVTVSESDAGFQVLLDGRKVKTPAKSELCVPTQRLAQAIAKEWAAQQEVVDPTTMPFTRSANAAIDKVTVQFEEVAAMLGEYATTDLLCYRADSPAELAERQAKAWDPMLDWVAETYNARLMPAAGVMFRAQDENSLKKLQNEASQFTAFELTGFHDLVTICGSYILALAVSTGKLNPDEAWEMSQIDERWQEEQWGEDEEATEHSRLRRASFIHAADFLEYCSK